MITAIHFLKYYLLLIFNLYNLISTYPISNSFYCLFSSIIKESWYMTLNTFYVGRLSEFVDSYRKDITNFRPDCKVLLTWPVSNSCQYRCRGRGRDWQTRPCYPRALSSWNRAEKSPKHHFILIFIYFNFCSHNTYWYKM